MQATFKERTHPILMNNQICDHLASNERHQLTQIPLDHPGLPNIFFIYQNNIFTSVNTPLTLALLTCHKTYLQVHSPKRLDWLFSDQCDSFTTTHTDIIPFQNILPKLTQSLIFTKERAFSFYQKDFLSLPPHILQKRRTVYNQINCHLCSTFKDNHEHGNTTCIIAQKVHNLMVSKIIDYIKKENPPNPNWKLKIWFSHNIHNSHIDPQPYPDFKSKWGDKGIVPSTLINNVNTLKLPNPLKAHKKITKIFHKLIATKWKIKFYSIYNQQIQHSSLLQDNNILKFSQM